MGAEPFPSLTTAPEPTRRPPRAVLPRLTTGAPFSAPASPVIETHALTKQVADGGVKLINRYALLGELGRGVHGKVKLARHIDTGALHAVKIVRKTPRTRRLGALPADGAPHLDKIRAEIAILKKCIHPNVVRLFEVIDDPASDKVYLVLEYLDGGEIIWRRPYTPASTLPRGSADTVPSPPPPPPPPLLSPTQVRAIFRDVLAGLEYLHTQGIIHRDVKPANLLRDSSSGAVKLADFGVSHFSSRQFAVEQKALRGEERRRRRSSSLQALVGAALRSRYKKRSASAENETPPSSTALAEEDAELSKTAGSPAFFAPELCVYHGGGIAGVSSSSTTNSPIEVTVPSGDPPPSPSPAPPITKAIDVWALGVTLYCLAFGTTPFTAASEYELFEVIPTAPLVIPQGTDLQLADLLQRLLDKNPATRISLAAAKVHPWTLADLDKQQAAAWLAATDPIQYTKVAVTDAEVRDAVGRGVLGKLRRSVQRLSASMAGISSAVLSFRRRTASVPAVGPPQGGDSNRPSTAPDNSSSILIDEHTPSPLSAPTPIRAAYLAIPSPRVKSLSNTALDSASCRSSPGPAASWSAFPMSPDSAATSPVRSAPRWSVGSSDGEYNGSDEEEEEDLEARERTRQNTWASEYEDFPSNPPPLPQEEHLHVWPLIAPKSARPIQEQDEQETDQDVLPLSQRACSPKILSESSLSELSDKPHSNTNKQETMLSIGDANSVPSCSSIDAPRIVAT